MIARTAIPLLAALLFTRVALIPTLITLTAVLRWRRQRQRRTRALNFLWRTLEAAELLTKRLNLTLVGGLLALCFFEEFEEFVQLIEGLAQCGDDLHHFVHGFANGRRLRRLERPEWKLWRTFLTFLAHRRRRTLLAPLYNRFGRLLFSLSLSIGRRRKIAFLILLLDRLGITSYVMRDILSWRNKRRLGHVVG